MATNTYSLHHGNRWLFGLINSQRCIPRPLRRFLTGQPQFLNGVPHILLALVADLDLFLEFFLLHLAFVEHHF